MRSLSCTHVDGFAFGTSCDFEVRHRDQTDSDSLANHVSTCLGVESVGVDISAIQAG